MPFRQMFKACGVQWRYDSGQRNGVKWHTYTPSTNAFPVIRSDKRLKPKAFLKELDRITLAQE